MPVFKERYPERDATPPVISGQPQWNSRVLPKLRRMQLVHLAKAYDIKVNPDGTKDQLLATLVAAEQLGVFQRPLADQYYLARAMLTPDDQPMGPWHGLLPIDERNHGVKEVPADALLSERIRAKTTRKVSWRSPGQQEFRHLQAECHKRKITCGSKTAAWMKQAIKEYDAAQVTTDVPSDEETEDAT